METFIKDIRYALRSFLKQPGFTAIAVLTLALGIGACTAIFSVVDAVLLRPLPYPHSEQIVQLRELSSDGNQLSFAEANFLDLRARSRTIEAVAEYAGDRVTVTGGNEPVRAVGFAVSSDFFRVVGTAPAVGRTFTADDSRTGASPAVVISYAFWQRFLNGNSKLSESPLQIRDQSFTVIGVMPPGFAFPQAADIWVPRELFPPETERSAHNWDVVARVRLGSSIEQVRAEVSSIGKQLKAEYAKDMDAVDFALIPQQEYEAGNVRGVLLITLAAVGFLLAVACANVTNLLLAQVTTRQKEFSLRSALGATRARLARQFITENALLVLTGAALGVMLSLWSVRILLSLNQSLPRPTEIGIDGRVILFTLALSIVIAIVLAVVPLLRLSSRNLETSLKEAGQRQSGPSGQRARGLLVIAQTALTLILLVGAGLLGKSFYRLLQIDPGFRTQSVVVMELSLPGVDLEEGQIRESIEAYKRLMERGIAPDKTLQFTPAQETRRRFRQQAIERLSQIPGVNAIGSINRLPLTGSASSGTFLINNNPAKQGYAEYRLASAGYFSALRIPILSGRVFDQSDLPDSPNAAVISQSLARRYWPNENPIGQTIQFGNMDGDLRLLHVVGIVGDVHDRGVDSSVSPTIYANAAQRLPSSDLAIVVRSQSSPAATVSAMRQAVQSMNPNLPTTFRTLDQILSSSLDRQRFSLVVFAVFAIVALSLAAMGIYGVTSYVVAQRTREIGIRIALGAQVRDVLGLVLKSSVALALVGSGLGLAGAMALTRLMKSLLYEVGATDVATFTAVPVLLIAVALVACLIPARRATKVDPLVALRYE
jgi:putative ABC transport system permease protein